MFRRLHAAVESCLGRFSRAAQVRPVLRRREILGVLTRRTESPAAFVTLEHCGAGCRVVLKADRLRSKK